MKVFSVYCDNGETGTNFEREAFQRMISTVVNELQEVGYVSRRKVRGTDGRIQKMEYEVFEVPGETEVLNEEPSEDEPHAEEYPEEIPEEDNPYAENPAMEHPCVDTPLRVTLCEEKPSGNNIIIEYRFIKNLLQKEKKDIA